MSPVEVCLCLRAQNPVTKHSVQRKQFAVAHLPLLTLGFQLPLPHQPTPNLNCLPCLCYLSAAGARFAKWRSVVSIPHGPSTIAVRDCAYGLARYAAIAQNAGLVPIVEPEVRPHSRFSAQFSWLLCHDEVIVVFVSVSVLETSSKQEESQAPALSVSVLASGEPAAATALCRET